MSYNGALVAILVRLSDLHGDDANKWFVEVGFGSVKRLEGRSFDDLDSSLPHIEAAVTRDCP